MKAGRWACVQEVGRGLVVRLVVTECPDGTTRGDVLRAVATAGLPYAEIVKPVHESKWSDDVRLFLRQRPVQFAKLATLQNRGESRQRLRKLSVRVTPELHDRLQRAAEHHGMSLQELCVNALTEVAS